MTLAISKHLLVLHGNAREWKGDIVISYLLRRSVSFSGMSAFVPSEEALNYRKSWDPLANRSLVGSTRSPQLKKQWNTLTFALRDSSVVHSVSESQVWSCLNGRYVQWQCSPWLPSKQSKRPGSHTRPAVWPVTVACDSEIVKQWNLWYYDVRPVEHLVA